jgi:hypothetical protein
MNRKRALIAFAIGILLLEVALISGLKFLGADSETLALAYVLLLCGTGLGVGGIVTRYRW